MYFEGLFIGDGFVNVHRINSDGTKYYKIGIIVNEYNVEEIKRCLGKYYIELEKDTKDSKYKYYSLKSSNQELAKYLIDNYGRISSEKKFPKDLSNEDFFELLSGMIDSDGFVDDYSCCFMNTNYSLCEHLSEELKLRGVKTSLYQTKKAKGTQKACWTVRIKSEDIQKLDVNLRVKYKQDRLNALKLKSVGGYTEINEEFLNTNLDSLKKLYSKSQISRLVRGTTKRIRTKYYNKILDNN